MDVFNITDKEGQKLKDKATIARIEDYICKVYKNPWQSSV
jgi:hypothetical protein